MKSLLKNKPRFRKYCIRGVAFLAVVALLVVGTFFWLGHEDRKFSAFMASGANINKFLKAYGNEMKAAVANQNADGLLDFYADSYQSPNRGSWKLSEPVDVKGVAHSKLNKIGDAAFGREELKSELSSYVSGLKSVEWIACKINLAEEIEPEDSARVTVKFVLDGVSKDGEVLQDRFFYRWWLAANDSEIGWEVTKEELLQDSDIDNTRDASRKPGFDLLNLADAGVDFVHRRDPKLDPDVPGIDLKFAVIQHASGGVTTADYNNDGLMDILFLDGVQCRLYRHAGISSNGSVRFEDVTTETQLEGLDRAHCGLFADFDNDGDKDLFVSRYGAPNRLYVNENNVYVDRSSEWGMDFLGPCVSATCLDYDRDGFPDIYVAVNGDAVNEVPRIPFFARNGNPNRLFRNVDGKSFEDVTEKAGVGDVGWSLAVCSGDLNGDGWTDIGVANDFGRKNIYMNQGDGTFTEVAKKAGTLDFSGGMGIAFGDLNNDGKVDIYTSNIYSNQRWLGEKAALMQYVRNTVRSEWLFRDFGEFADIYKITDGNWQALGKMAGEGNSMFINKGDGTFREARESCTNRAGWGWAVALFDADNDADLDIYAANGWITGEITDDL